MLAFYRAFSSSVSFFAQLAVISGFDFFDFVYVTRSIMVALQSFYLGDDIT